MRLSRVLIKIAAAPFAMLYMAATSLRNHLFNIGYTRSFRFETKVAAVGNLSAGGAGKTPMVEYILELLLSNGIKPAALSRGYKRLTRGFRIAGDQDNALTIGDEPYQFYLKYGQRATVAVGEERALAIPNILFERPDTQAIVLDDAYQHRYVVPDLNILLTDYSLPFYKDHILPLGRLRESRKEAARADVVVVSKCPANISEETMAASEKEIHKYSKPGTPVFFTSIGYQQPEPVFSGSGKAFYENILLVTGIANNKPLVDYVSERFSLIETIAFPDHHRYTENDLLMIADKFEKAPFHKKTILTTEKDSVKMLNLQENNRLRGLSFYYLPITTLFIKNGRIFDQMLLDITKN